MIIWPVQRIVCCTEGPNDAETRLAPSHPEPVPLHRYCAILKVIISRRKHKYTSASVLRRDLKSSSYSGEAFLELF